MIFPKEIQERGYDVVSLVGIKDAQLGALCKAIGRLGTAAEDRYRAQHPHPTVAEFGANMAEELQRYGLGMHHINVQRDSALAQVVSWANSRGPMVYSGAVALFGGEAPKMLIGHMSHPTEADLDHNEINELYFFDGFAGEFRGADEHRVAHLAVSAVLNGQLVSHDPRLTLGSMPEDFFARYRQPVAAATA